MRKIPLTLFLAAIGLAQLGACATTSSTTRFSAPTEAGVPVYVYRESSFYGAALRINVSIDNQLLGQLSQNAYMYKTFAAPRTVTVQLVEPANGFRWSETLELRPGIPCYIGVIGILVSQIRVNRECVTTTPVQITDNMLDFGK